MRTLSYVFGSLVSFMVTTGSIAIANPNDSAPPTTNQGPGNSVYSEKDIQKKTANAAPQGGAARTDTSSEASMSSGDQSTHTSNRSHRHVGRHHKGHHSKVRKSAIPERAAD